MSPVAQRVHHVLDIFGKLNAAPKDGGYCGPRGRIITATMSGEGYTLTAILRRQPTGVYPDSGYLYIVEFQFHTIPGAQPLHLMEGALKMATLHNEVPIFTANECALVDGCLDDIFGRPTT